jgi:hypothetical protein
MAVDIVAANEFTFSPSSFVAAYTEDIVTDVTVIESTANTGSLTTVPHSTALASSLINANKEVASASVVQGHAPKESVSVTGYAPLITAGFAPVTAIAKADGASGGSSTTTTTWPEPAYAQASGSIYMPFLDPVFPPTSSSLGGGGGSGSASAAVAGVQGTAAPGVPGQVAAGAPGVPGVSPGNTGPLSVSGTVVDFMGQIVTDTRSVTKTTTKSVSTYVVLVLTYGTYKANAPSRTAALATVALIFSKVKEYLESL